MTAFEELEDDAEWPFVTYDMFEVGANHLRRQSRVEGIVMTPIIEARLREQWVEYSVANQGWIQDSRAIAKELDPQFTQENFVNGTINEDIWIPCNDDTPEKCSAPTAPVRAELHSVILYFLWNFLSH